mmetsp:Transcript_93405/g.268980  ORF Transcript_93405/g.268980 Transcript_93405/m.268980 type:complete len:203 (-) Transcript_93405:354-962(-)
MFPPTLTSCVAALKDSSKIRCASLRVIGKTSKARPRPSLNSRETFAVSRIRSDSRVTKSTFDNTNCKHCGVVLSMTRLSHAIKTAETAGWRCESAKQSTMPARAAIQANASLSLSSPSAWALTSTRSTASNRGHAAAAARHMAGSGKASGNCFAAAESKDGSPTAADAERTHRNGAARDPVECPAAATPAGPPAGCNNSSCA